MSESNVTTEYLNFKRLKEQTDVQEMLKIIGFDEFFTLNQETNELTGKCPLGKQDAPPHGDNSSFAFNIKKKTFQCFACKKRGSVIDFIKYMRETIGRDVDLRGAAQLLGEINKRVMGDKDYNKDLIQSYKEQIAIKQASGYEYEVTTEKETALVAENAYQETQTIDLDQKIIDAGREALNRKLEAIKGQEIITNPETAKEIAELKTGSLHYESIGMILGNAKHAFIDYVELAKGSSQSARPSLNFLIRAVIKHGASAVILCHNHPSGRGEVSMSDQAFTDKAKELLDVIEVNLLDHIIVASPTLSMAEEGLI